MCLNIDNARTTRYKSWSRNKRNIYVYKLLNVDVNGPYSPFQHMVYKPGMVIALDYLDQPVVQHNYSGYGRIMCGLHAYTSKKRAISARYGYQVVVRLTVKPADIMAVGPTGDVAVTKAFFPKKEYEKAIRKAKKP